jgi:hypothetical protein
LTLGVVEVDHDELLAEMEAEQGEPVRQAGPVPSDGVREGVPDGTGLPGDLSSRSALALIHSRLLYSRLCTRRR